VGRYENAAGFERGPIVLQQREVPHSALKKIKANEKKKRGKRENYHERKRIRRGNP